jgi:hypothetical protein
MKPRDVLAKMRYCLTCTFAGTKIIEFCDVDVQEPSQPRSLAP